jgi:hypothetical protein
MNAHIYLQKFNGLLGEVYAKMGADLLYVHENGNVHCRIEEVHVERCSDGDYVAHVCLSSAAGEFNGGHWGMDPDDFLSEDEDGCLSEDYEKMAAWDAEHCHELILVFFSTAAWVKELEACIVALKEVA